jgi:hypothetical protein
MAWLHGERAAQPGERERERAARKRREAGIFCCSLALHRLVGEMA